jgi:hypothetical protein
MEGREFIQGIAAAVTVKTVYVVTKCHLDVGFTDTEQKVLHKYFNEYLPNAITLAETLRNANNGQRYVWTIAAWMIDQYLEQASSPDRKRMEDAIAAGDIAWHAMPFTWQSEMLDRSLISSSLGISAALDRRFGKKTIAGKLTDVPGHTLGLIAPLAEAGIEFLDIGDNPGCKGPDVPSIPVTIAVPANPGAAEPVESDVCLFNYRNPSGQQIMVLYHALGYGGTAAIPGTDVAVSIRVSMDNGGPDKREDVEKYYSDLSNRFPGAKIVATDLSTVAAALRSIRQSLPVVTQEMGDTWIYGVGSDPGKVSRYREMCRLRRDWIAAKRFGLGDKVDLALTSRLILIPEHNWGLAGYLYLQNYRVYTPGELAQARATKPEFQAVDAEWTAKRRDVEIAIATLPENLQTEARERLAALEPHPPESQNLASFPPGKDLKTAALVLAFDDKNGSIVKLTDRQTGREWASPHHPLALFQYETFTSRDFDRFNKQYNTQEWAWNDFGKPGMEDYPTESRTWQPILDRCSAGRENGADRVLLELRMPALNDYVSWPEKITVELTIPDGERAVYIDLQCFNKRANRLAEAMWFSFSPDAPDTSGWRLEKVEQPVSPLEVMSNGSRHLHAVTKDVTYRDKQGGFTLETLDAPLIAPGQRSLLDFDNKPPDMREGLHVNLYNNLWGTAFPQWYGYDMRFRFVMRVE